MRRSLALMVISFAGLAWSQPSPIIKTETRVVLVDAVVTGKKGEFVRDLTAKDFHVWEDKKEQNIQSFTLESAAAPAKAAEPQTSYLVLLLDYADMDGAAQIRARQAAASFIDANTTADHVIAVANFDGEFRIAQGFTANAGRLKDAVTGSKAQVASISNATTGTSARADLGARDLFRSVRDLALDLGSVPGRKTIVLLTGGLVASNDQKPALTEAIEACGKSNVAIYPIDVRDVSLLTTLTAEDAAPSTSVGPGAAARGGMPVGRSTAARGDADPSAALDPGGVSQQVLFALASGTGGFVIRNATELPTGLQKIGQEQQEYYILGYTPPESKEGTCHQLRVKVDRSGTTVRARSSYCTGKAQELLTGSAADRELENRAASGQGSIAASMQLPYFYVGPNTARVNVAMEIARGAVKFEHKKAEAHAEVDILGVASQAQGPDEGAVVARFSDTLNVDVDDATAEKDKDKPLHYEKEFKIAPGQYKLTVAFSSGGEGFGKIEQRLDVGPYQPGQAALSAVAFGKEVRKAGADAGVSLFDDRTPLITGGMQLIPSGSNVFTKSEKAYCFLEVYAADPAKPGAIGVRILDAKTGDLKWDGGAMKLDAFANGKAAIPVGFDLPMDMLAPGSYQLEIRNGDGVKRLADFEVK